MKKTIIYLFACISAGFVATMGLSGCTDMKGDGVDSVLWNGSANQQAKSFINPVWEPSLEAGTVFKGSSGFVAISSTTQWSKGIDLYCPQITSADLMNWSAVNNAFNTDAVPSWAPGRIVSLTVDFCKTLLGEKYWMFYNIEGTEGIGVATSLSVAQGPYTDLQTNGNKLQLKTTGAPRNPFFFAVSANFYLCYTTDQGTYLQKLTLKKATMPICSGDPTLIAGPGFEDVAILRVAADNIYIFGTVNGEIRYARADNLIGNYAGKDGVALTAGGKGDALITTNSNYNKVENPMRAFLNSANTHIYLAYNATQSDKEVMTSGYARRPMFVQPMELDENGWIKGTYTPEKKWTSPKYE